MGNSGFKMPSLKKGTIGTSSTIGFVRTSQIDAG